MLRVRAFGPLLFLSVVVSSAQTNVIVPLRSLWRYSDVNSSLPSSWKQPGFNDTGWGLGQSPLGFGQSGVSLLQNGIMTAYFRKKFTLPSAPESWLTLRVRRDDGVIVYLNGVEVLRNNMPAGPVNHYTAALQAVDPTGFVVTNMGASLLLPGENLLAAEVHQHRIDSPDLFFDLEVFGTNGGPRLFITSPANNVAVRTGTDLAINALAEPVSEMASVEFFQNDQSLGADAEAPFGIVWTGVPAGNHLVRVVATTRDGFVFGSAPIQIQVADNFAPSGFLTSPPGNATVSLGDITLEASASDPDGVVTLVEFFANGVKVGEDASAPYSVVWTNATIGNHAIMARITDDSGLTVETAGVTLHVRLAGGVPRGPYLQSGTPNSIIVKWRTEVDSDSHVRYGVTPGNLNRSTLVSGTRTEHAVQLTDLSPNTRYYYSIGSSTLTYASGPTLFFVTSPAGPKPTRVWVIGDSGTATPDAARVYDAYLQYTGERYTDMWLMLGDNAYGTGTDAEYQRAMFDMYPALLAQTVVWPTIGNHDATPAYFDIFSLPRNGEAGGVPSGVENYYSFNYSDIHFICLGGYYSSSLHSNGPMCTWLKADLEANTSKWTIAYWHQPPYSKGSHDSDAEGDLIAMRENAVPILESYGVDVVLGGHSHSYERSFLMRGHYGSSWDLDRASMLLDPGSGRVGDTGAYIKRTTGPKAHHGTVYIVAGTSGHATFGSMDHPVMFVSYLRMGSLILDIDGDTLEGTFLRLDGAIDDYFTLTKREAEVRIESIRREAGRCILSWSSVTDRNYQIEFSSSLGAAWTKVYGPIKATGWVTSAEHAPAEAASGFYRVVQLD